MATATSAPHKWKFYRVGGLDQVALETGADLAHLHELNQKLWVALSCPTKGLELDVKTLELLDLDKDGRVRAPEILAALTWCEPRLKGLGELIPGRDSLALAAIDTGTPEGKALFGAARQILLHAGLPDAAEVRYLDLADVVNVFAGTPFNGDGVVPADSAEDPETKAILEELLGTVSGVPDRSGKQGTDQVKLDLFFAELAAFAEWSKAGDEEGLRSLGEATAPAFEAFKAVRTKIDDYFTRCRLAAFDPRAGAILNRGEAELVALAAKDLATPGDEVAALPIALVEAGRPLPLAEGANPAWTARLGALQRDAIVPALGASAAALTEAQWGSLKEKLARYEAWRAAEKGAVVSKLGLPRVLALLAGPGKAAIEALIAKDKALEFEAAAIADVVRMVHYRRDLHTLLKNFVNFGDFYDGGEPAIFQAGTLYLDSRSCDLCVKVDDFSAHAVLGSLSRMYIAYCDLKRPGMAPMKIAACFTQGDSDYLMVGRNGIFYDRLGRDWDANITKIIDNPISIRQAFWAPYKKFVRIIEEQVTAFAAAKEKEAEARMHATAGSAAAAASGVKPPAPPAAVDVGKMVGIIAALGVGAGAIGTLFGGLVSGFIGLEPWWAKLLAVLGIVLAISLPSMLLAWLKLRQRTLGPVLDANGWAVNGRVRVNLPLGTALTGIKELPPNSTRSLDDPFEDKQARLRRRLIYLALLIFVLATLGARHYRVWPFHKSPPVPAIIQ